MSVRPSVSYMILLTEELIRLWSSGNLITGPWPLAILQVVEKGQPEWNINHPPHKKKDVLIPVFQQNCIVGVNQKSRGKATSIK